MSSGGELWCLCAGVDLHQHNYTQTVEGPPWRCHWPPCLPYSKAWGPVGVGAANIHRQSPWHPGCKTGTGCKVRTRVQPRHNVGLVAPTPPKVPPPCLSLSNQHWPLSRGQEATNSRRWCVCVHPRSKVCPPQPVLHTGAMCCSLRHQTLDLSHLKNT